jgi:Xaa-Pro dipeptidase
VAYASTMLIQNPKLPNDSLIEPKELYLRRWHRTKSQMRVKGIPALLILDPNNIFYATGAQNMELFTVRVASRYLLLFADGPSILFEYFGCEHLAVHLPTISEVLPAEGLDVISSGGQVHEAADRFAAQIKQIAHEVDPRIQSLAVDRFPFQAIDALRACGFKLTNADEIFVPVRSIKMPCEFEYMRESMQRIQGAVAALEKSIEPGRTETQIWAELHKGLIASGGRYVTARLCNSGPSSYPWFQECSQRTVAAGDLVCLDTDAHGFEGYAADFSRTFLCGDGAPKAEQRRLYNVAREQLEWNTNLIYAGMEFREFASRAWKVPPEHQASRYYCIGHGLGLSGEWPNIPYYAENLPYPLTGRFEAGMVICLESYIGSRNSGEGVKLETQLMIHETRIETMSTYPFDDRLDAHPGPR